MKRNSVLGVCWRRHSMSMWCELAFWLLAPLVDQGVSRSYCGRTADARAVIVAP